MVAQEQDLAAASKKGGYREEREKIKKKLEVVRTKIAAAGPTKAGLDKELAELETALGLRVQAKPDLAGLGTAEKWAYEGPRPTSAGGFLYQADGNAAACSRGGRTMWRVLSPAGADFSPPAVAGKCVYLCDRAGRVVCLDRGSGEVKFAYALGHKLAFQPSVAAGCLYFGTADGLLVCLETGNADADGWYCWGGNARHNPTE